MKRRNFLGAAGAYATLIRRPAEAQDAATAHKRARIDLNGAWDQSVDGHFVRTIQAPSSNRPLGRYDLSREFVLPRLTSDEHAILHFEGLTFFGRAFCNDTELGSLIPYVPHEFDIAGAVRERSNTIRVSIADLIPGTDGAGADEIALGVNQGWEAYGGIIREVWIELRPATFIENAQLRYTLEPGFRAGHCVVRAFLRSRGPVTGKAEAKLLRAGRTFAKGVQAFSTAAGAGEADIAFEIADPAMWSPESPDFVRCHRFDRIPHWNRSVFVPHRIPRVPCEGDRIRVERQSDHSRRRLPPRHVERPGIHSHAAANEA